MAAKTLTAEQRHAQAAQTLEHVNEITETLTLFNDDPTAMKARQAIYDELKAGRIDTEDYGNIDYQDFRATDKLLPELKYLAYDNDEGTVFVCARIKYTRKDKETGETLQLEKRYADTDGCESFKVLWEPPARLRRLLQAGREYLASIIPPGVKIDDQSDAKTIRNLMPRIEDYPPHEPEKGEGSR